MKELIQTTPEWDLYIERATGRWWGHIDIHHWNPGVARKLVRVFDDVVRELGEPVYLTHMPTQGPKHIKFISRYGFVPTWELILNSRYGYVTIYRKG
jgi:hypothetical protein